MRIIVLVVLALSIVLLYSGSYSTLIYTYSGGIYHSTMLPTITPLIPREHIIKYEYPGEGEYIHPDTKVILQLGVSERKKVSLSIEVLSREGIVEKLDYGANSNFKVELSYPFEWRLKILVGVLDNSSTYDVDLEIAEIKPTTVMLIGIDPLKGFTLALAGIIILSVLLWKSSSRRIIINYEVYLVLPVLITLDYLSTFLAGEEFEKLFIPKMLYSMMGFSEFFIANIMLSILFSLILFHAIENRKYYMTGKIF